MEISRLPKSFFLKARRKFKIGNISFKKDKLYFEDLNGDVSEVKYSPDWEQLDGTPFKISFLRNNTKPSVKIRTDEIFNAFFSAGKVSPEFEKKMEKKGEIAKYEYNGMLIANGQVVLLSDPVMLYDDWRLFMGECDIIEKPNFQRAKMEAREAKEERKKRAKNEKLIEENKNKTAWNDRIKSKQTDLYDAAEWILSGQVYDKSTKRRVGFYLKNILNQDDREEHYCDLETVKNLCDNFKVKNVKWKNGKFIGNGDLNVPVDELPQFYK